MNTPQYYGVEIPIVNKNFQDFNPVLAGYMHCPPSATPNQATRPHYLMHYIVSGSGYFSLNDEAPKHLTAGQLFIIPPYTKYFYTPDKNDPWYYIFIGFNGTLALNYLYMDSVYEFDHPELFNNIKESVNLTSHVAEYLAAQLFMIYRYLSPPEKSGNYYVNIIKHQICSSYMNDITVESLAKYCNINKNYASMLFKKETGMSIREFIIYYRMQRAVELLQTGYSVENTAHMIGYKEYHSFTKQFKNFFGHPPSKYKKPYASTYNSKNYVPQFGQNPFKNKNDE